MMTKPVLVVGLAMLGPGLLSVPAHAQDSERVPTIIVEGIPEVDGSDARQQARDITFPRESSAEALARFNRPVCVGVFGLQPVNARDVISRIYDNAEYAGIAVNDAPGCGANVWVMIVNDPAATFGKLKDERSWMVRRLSRFDRKRVAQQDGPVRAWNLTTVRDENEQPVPTGAQVAEGAQLARTMGLPMPSAEGTWASRVRVPVRREIEMSIILVARSALGDIDAHALADYATMRALGRTEEPEIGEWTYDTVLNLFDDGARVERLSAFDRAYLKSLYSGSAYRRASMGLASLKSNMEKELVAER